MEDNLKGQCLVWTSVDYPPDHSKNIIWLKIDKEGRYINLFIKVDKVWTPIGINDSYSSSDQTMSSEAILKIAQGAGIHIGEDQPLNKEPLWIIPSTKSIRFYLDGEYIEIQAGSLTQEQIDKLNSVEYGALVNTNNIVVNYDIDLSGVEGPGVSLVELSESGVVILPKTNIRAVDGKSTIEEAKAGTDNSTFMTPLAVKYAILEHLYSSNIIYQYSIDGLTDWHESFTVGDMFYRVSLDGGITWGPSILINGGVGTNGSYSEFRFTLSEPFNTPSYNANNDPSGSLDGKWGDKTFTDIPRGIVMWATMRLYRDGYPVQGSTWQPPFIMSGQEGVGGRLAILSGEYFKYNNNYEDFVGPEYLIIKFESLGIDKESLLWFLLDSNNEYIKISDLELVLIYPTDAGLKLAYSSLQGKSIWVESSIKIKLSVLDLYGLTFNDEASIMKITGGAHAYNVTIISTKGDVFKPGLDNTRLRAIVYFAGEYVDDSGFNKFTYEWQRFDKDGIKDEEFVPRYYTVLGVDLKNSILINDKDVEQRATFNCIIYKK